MIEWVDSYFVHEQWDLIDNIPKTTINNCVSVGFVMGETDDAITVIPHISGINDRAGESGSGGICIPRVAITNEIRLTFPFICRSFTPCSI